MHKRWLLKLGDPQENPVANKSSNSAGFQVAWEECLLLVEFIGQQCEQKYEKQQSVPLSTEITALAASALLSVQDSSGTQNAVAVLHSPHVEMRTNVIDIAIKLRKGCCLPSQEDIETKSELSNTILQIIK